MRTWTTNDAEMSVERYEDKVEVGLGEYGGFEGSCGSFTVEQVGQIVATLTALATEVDGPRFRAAFMEAALGYLGDSPAPEEGLSSPRVDLPRS